MRCNFGLRPIFFAYQAQQIELMGIYVIAGV